MRMIPKIDIINTAPVFDAATGKWEVHEQLYPECRGFAVHLFDTEKAAQAAMDGEEDKAAA